MTDVVLEIAQIDVLEGTEERFEAAVAEAVPLFRGARGCKGLRLARSVELPRRYRLMVEWETLEAHTVDFRSSDAYRRWRELVSAYFDGAPQVEHVQYV
jgi:heme-degrading monooxygenase HmoA